MSTPTPSSPRAALSVFVAGVALAAFTARAAPPPAKAPPEPVPDPYVLETLTDGTTLIFARTPGSRMASFRFVIRAGGSNDPDGRAGLAHLLEHLVFHGTYSIGEGEIFHATERAGGTLNAFTSPDSTVYVLDAPRDAFLSLIERYTSMVTSPALPMVKLDREKGVVDAEHALRNMTSMMWALDQQIFPSRNRGMTVIGTKDSRAEISLDDVRNFYELNYTPLNAAIVVAGDFQIDEVRRVLERSLLWPPKLPPPPADDPAVPNVPSSAKALSWVTATGAAYLVDGVEKQVCEAIGALIDMRLRKKVVIEEVAASHTAVFCHEVRGHQFIVSLAFTSTPLGNQLPTTMRQLFAEARKGPPTAAEKAALEAHARVAHGMMLARASALADKLSAGAAQPGTTIAEGTKRAVMQPRFDWSAMQQALLKSLTDQNFVLLHFSPFEES